MESAVPGSAEAVLSRLPPWTRRVVEWLLSRWPGRIAIRSAATSIRIELFDRSMTIAAQFFTSVFPILIMVAAWAGSDDTGKVADVLNMPEESQSVLNQAIDGSGTTSTTFGIVGALIVLVSATSLARALTRAFAAVWDLPRPRSSLRSAWRWLAVVLTLALSLVVVRALSAFAAGLPPANVWRLVVSLACDLVVVVFVPWVLLSGVVPPRRLLPGALLFALVMLFVRPAAAVWLPRALEVSAERYGSLGVAFTYLAWLYVVAFCCLATAAVGQVIATDDGWFGSWIRGQATVEDDHPLGAAPAG